MPPSSNKRAFGHSYRFRVCHRQCTSEDRVVDSVNTSRPLAVIEIISSWIEGKVHAKIRKGNRRGE